MGSGKSGLENRVWKFKDGTSKLKIQSWKIQSWKFKVGNSKLEIQSWKFKIGTSIVKNESLKHRFSHGNSELENQGVRRSRVGHSRLDMSRIGYVQGWTFIVGRLGGCGSSNKIQNNFRNSRCQNFKLKIQGSNGAKIPGRNSERSGSSEL